MGFHNNDYSKKHSTIRNSICTTSPHLLFFENEAERRSHSIENQAMDQVRRFRYTQALKDTECYALSVAMTTILCELMQLPSEDAAEDILASCQQRSMVADKDGPREIPD